jgi:hypothetical protein
MIRTVIKSLLLYFLLTTLVPASSNAQNITGIWRGYFITENLEQYKFELQIKQTGSSVSGVSYSYLSTVFYGKATLTGIFNRSGQNALIKEIKTVELKMSGTSMACIMKCIFKYERSGKEEFLEGTFTSKFETDGPNVKKGDNCGGGKVYLRKVTTSDFYIEPFLRNKIKPVDRPVIVNKPPVKKEEPKTNPPVVIKKNPVTKPPVITKPVQKPMTPPITKKDSTITRISEPPVIKKITPDIPTPKVIKERSNELVKTLIVTSPDVTVKLYDNGEIDGDTISVYLDKKLVLSNKMLTAAPLVVKLKMDEENDEHELTMVAENLGSIPPNTSLMIVEAGEQRFEVRITSTEQKNAVVRFKYQKPNK